MARERVDLSALAHEVAADLARSDPQRHVTVEIADGLVADGDPRLLRSVLENLIGNAFKFTRPRADARIEVGSSVGPDGVRVFHVRDNGVGFDMAYSDKLFGTFQRLHGNADFEGNGIGLASVLRVVRRHGGRAWAEARPREGATFFFTL